MSIGSRAKKLLRSWRRQWVPLLISLSITASSFFIYRRTFIGEQADPAFEFVHRMELAALDARFQLRHRLWGPTPPDPRIVIVAIDQASQEALGRWPFPRIHFASLVDRLHDDGARVIAFDVAFSQPDESAHPLRELRQRLEASKAPSAEITKTLEREFDYDRRLAESMARAGNVVLGNFFFFDPREARSLEGAAERDNLLEFFAMPSLRMRAGANQHEAVAGAVQQVREFSGLPLGAEVNRPPFVEAVAQRDFGMGFFNIRPDPDGVVRQALFLIPYASAAAPNDWNFYASLELQAVRAYLGADRQQGVVNLSETGIENIELGSGILVRCDEVGQAALNFRGPAGTYPTVSLASVVRGSVPAGFFRGKIVLVGATALGIGDIRATPYGRLDFPGVEIRANAVDNILHGDFLQRGALQNRVDEWLIFIFGVPLGLWLAIVRPRWTWFSILLMVPFAAGVMLAFQRGWWLNAVMPALFTLVPNTTLVALYRVLVEEREKRRIRVAFQQYLSPEVIRRLLENPELVRPRKVEITTVFSDIRGFTSLAEQLDAQQLALLLNDYLSEMTRIVFRHRGTLDKYIGDALMAFWGAPFEEPGHASRACRASLEMLSRLDFLKQRWSDAGRPTFDIGFGINTGVASVGNMGSELRHAYTAMGDSVNLASRLESLNRVYGTRILAAQDAADSARNDADAELCFRELDLIRAKGKQQAVLIYELVGFRAALSAEQLERLELFSEGRRLYVQRDWAGAKKRFDQLHREGAGDGPAMLFSENCAKCMIIEPPADWDGVFTLEHK